MTKGEIICTCGQLFGFETMNINIECPKCNKTYLAADYEVVDEIVTEEPPIEDGEVDGTDI